MALVNTSISFGEFCDAFRSMNRNENFSYEAKRALYDFMDEQYEQIEFDVIAICCDYSEDTIQDIIDNHNLDALDCDGEELSDEDKAELVRDFLNDNTLLVGETDQGSFVYACF